MSSPPPGDFPQISPEAIRQLVPEVKNPKVKIYLQEHLHTFLEAIPDTLRFKGSGGAWLIANALALKVFRLDQLEWQGLTDLELAERVPELADVFRKSAQSDTKGIRAGKPGLSEEAVTQPDGTVLVFDVTRVPMLKPDGSARGLLVLGHDITKRKQDEAELRRRNASLQQRVLDAAERERQQVGNELHDELGQLLHGIQYLAAELSARIESKGMPEAKEIDGIADSIGQALAAVRGISHGLQPVTSLPDGLATAFRDYAMHVRNIYNINCRFICPNPVKVAEPEVAKHLFRIGQEATCNAIKHSKCDRITLTLKSIDGRLFLRVRDNGNGAMPPLPPNEGIGLKVMQYRASAINGELTVQQARKGGTEVSCTVHPVATHGK